MPSCLSTVSRAAQTLMPPATKYRVPYSSVSTTCICRPFDFRLIGSIQVLEFYATSGIKYFHIPITTGNKFTPNGVSLDLHCPCRTCDIYRAIYHRYTYITALYLRWVHEQGIIVSTVIYRWLQCYDGQKQKHTKCLGSGHIFDDDEEE